MISVLFDLLNFIVLSITLFFLIKYTWATEKMAKYQMMPAIDVNMIYEKSIGKTYFWFKNESNFPGFVYLQIKKNEENKREVYNPLRISPKEKHKKTATNFDFSQKEEDRMILYISITSCLEKSNIKFEDKKSYIFKQNQWNEKSWSFPDPPFPGL